MAKETPAVDGRHHTILSLEVTGGFLKGAKLELVDGLNCIIGGRGTGKTTVLELIRYALGLMPDLRTSPARAKALGALVQTNLGGGRIRVEVETKHRVRYVAERPWNDTAQVFDQQGEPTALALDRDSIFRADVYSQNEIEEIATNSNLQLALIDKFIEEDLRRIDAEIQKVVRDLAQNASDLLRVSREMRDLRDGTAEAPAVEEKLKALQSIGGPDASLVNAAHALRVLRERERQAVGSLRDDLGRLKVDLDMVVAGNMRRLAARVDAEMAAGPNRDLLDALTQQVVKVVGALEAAQRNVGEQASVSAAVVAQHEPLFAERHAKQDAEYRALVAASSEDTGRAAERAQLQQRHLEIAKARSELALKDRERLAVEGQRQDLLGKLSGLRDDRFALRKRVAERRSASLRPGSRVSITQAGSQDGYQALLTEGLKGSGLRYAALVDKVSRGATPEELCRLVQYSDATHLSERVGIDLDRAQRVIDALRNTELMYRIETVELEDLPRIELLDGKGYKDSAGLSTGQRCTTILPILLLESERPLLIDQPEDNLDNAFIYETVVKRLKVTKTKRQLIFVTHNPNIPVLGDAGRVFVMESDGRQGRLNSSGTVDELKHDIEFLLEGGSEAFQLRHRRYGH